MKENNTYLNNEEKKGNSEGRELIAINEAFDSVHENGRTAEEQFLTALQLLEKEFGRSQHNTPKEGRSAKWLFLIALRSSREKFGYNQSDENITVDLVNGLKISDNGKSYLVGKFLSKNQNIPVDYVLKLVDGLNRKYYLVKEFLSEHQNIQVDDVIKLVNGLKFRDNDKSSLVKAFLSKNQNIQVDDVAELVNGLKISDYHKDDLVKAFLSEHQNIPVDDVIKLVNGLTISDDRKYYLVKAFLSEHQNIPADDVIKLVSLVSRLEMWDEDKFYLLSTFLSNNQNIPVDDVLKLVSELKISDNNKPSLVRKFLSNNQNITVSEFSKLIKGLGFEYSLGNIFIYLTDDSPLLNGWKKNKAVVKNLQELAVSLYPNIIFLQVEFLKSSINRKLITKDNFKELDFNRISEDDQLFHLFEYARQQRVVLSGDERFVIESLKGRLSSKYSFLDEVIKNNGNNNLSNYLTGEGIGYFTGLFKSTGLREPLAGITINDIISYCDLCNQTGLLSGYLQPEFKKSLVENFHPSEKILLVSNKDLKKLQDLLSGGDNNQNIGEETKSNVGNNQNIESKFFTTKALCEYFSEKIEIPSLTQEEKKSFKIRFRNNDNQQESKKEALEEESKEVTLEEESKEVTLEEESKEVTLEEESKEETKLTGEEQLNKANSEEGEQKKGAEELLNIIKFSEDEKEQLNVKFRTILLAENRNQEDVADFFASLTGGVINGGNKSKLCDFFQKSKDQIAYLLQQDGGVESIVTCLHTLSDGCSANIGNQFKIALYQTLFKDPQDSIIYQILMEKIVTQILNGAGDVIGAENDPLQNTKIKSYLISPEAFFNECSQEFYNSNSQTKSTVEKAKKRDSWEFIKNALRALGNSEGFSDDFKLNLLNSLNKKYEYKNEAEVEVEVEVEKEASRIAAIFIFKLVKAANDQLQPFASELGKFLESDYIKSLSNFVEGQIESIKEEEKKEERPNSQVSSRQSSSLEESKKMTEESENQNLIF